ncbi:unnamed protein product [Schistosoma curassoni]|uniref:Helicase ATP-binding domain-containing protein n=1 Tax=Schistosoma curassoni TaxID=6186 RepID=A0A183JXL8_9TREM|nr:unnamed protein product [Schistosoma curassoni]
MFLEFDLKPKSLDRLFVLLESCPNASLRTAAAEQLGEIAKSSPSSIDYVFTCLIPLLRHKNWVSRIAASEAIRHIVRHLPDWQPTLNCQSYIDQKDVSTNGFLSLSGLRIDYVLAQGARLYSMDARELDRNNSRGYFERCKKNNENAMECDTFDPQTDIQSQILPPVQRQEINSRLGLENDNLLTEVLESHADVSINKWITTDDFNDETQPGFTQIDVESCVRSAYVAHVDTYGKRFSVCQSPVHCDTKRIKLDSSSDVTIDKSGLNVQATVSALNQSSGHWPLDRMCTTLLGDLWALRWETRHGAASGLRELLSEPRHTKQAGKYIGQSETEMYNSHYQYLEDIVVRVLCTLALDQLSDFISDEVVAPVRETAAQLLGVLSLHLTTEQVLLVVKHLIFLVSLNDEAVTKLCTNIPCQKDNSNASKNSWMIAHGGLLGIKYLLASRKDLKNTLLPHVTPCLIGRLFGIPIVADNQTVSRQSGHPSSFSANTLADDEDIRAAAASALLPIIDTIWVESLSQYEYDLFVNHVWSLIRNTPSDLSPSTGPVLSLACALTKAEVGKRQFGEQHNSTIKSEEDVSTCLGMQFADFRNVCPIYFQRLFLISSSPGSWFVLFHSSLLLIVSGQRTLSILCKQLFVNTFTFLMMVVVVLQVSSPYNRTVLAFVLMILTLTSVDICFEFHMSFNCRNAVIALPILAFTSASDPPHSSIILPSLFLVFSSFSIYRVNTSEKIMIIAELLHHVSSSIRQSALNTLQCVIESCENQIESLSADMLHLILDNLFQRILLESCTSIRALVTNLTIKIIQAAKLDCLVQASLRRLDVWLCQVMQPTGIPYPNKFLVPCLRSNSDIQLTSELNSNNDELTSLTVRSTANIPSSNQQAVFIPQPTYCIGGFQCLTASRSEMESYVLETRISAVRVLAYLCSRICQYNQLIPVHLLPCISDNSKLSTSSLPSSVNNNEHNHINNTSISVLNYVIGQLICQLHLKDRLAMQRFISGLLLSSWSLLSPISSLPTGSGDNNDNNSMNSSNKLFNSMNPFYQINYIDKLTYTWSNLMNTSSSTLLSCHLEQLQNLAERVFTNIKIDLHDIAKQLRGRLESCLTEVIYYEEILAPFKLMQEDCRELIRLMKSGGLPVDSQIPINGVLTIVHCKILLQKVAEVIHTEKQHSVSSVIDSSLLDRLHCQLERTRTTVDHCLTLQLYLGNRVELGIACAFANMNWILPGRLSLLIRPLVDTIRCVKPCINQSDNAVRSLNSGTDGIFQTNSRPNITSTATSTSSIFGGSNAYGSSSSNSSAVGSCIDMLPIGTCVHLQRLAASCLARLLWLEWKMLSINTPSHSSSTLLTNKSLLPNTSKAATKVIKNLTSYLIESDPDFLLSLSSTSNLSSEASHQPNEDQSSVDTKIACVNSLSTYRLDLVTNTSSSSEALHQSSQRRGAYISLSCICYTFINLYHHEEGNQTCWSSSKSSSSAAMESIDHQPCHHRLSNVSLNSLRLGIPSLWHLFWINPVKIVINYYRQSGILVENGESMEQGGEISERRGYIYSTLKKLTDEIKVNMYKLKPVDLPKSNQDELLSGLIVLSSCLNVILPCIDPDKKETFCDQKDDISFEQIIWLASLVIRLPSIVYRRVGARVLADLTLLRPVYTLNILLPLLLFTSNGVFLPTDSSTLCVGTLETFLTIVEKFSNMHNSSSYILQSVPPVILDDPLAEPNSKSSSLLSMCRCFMNFVHEQSTLDFESKLPNELTTNITNNSNSEDGTNSLLSNNLKLFLPYVVLLLTPTLRLISNSNQHIRSTAGRLFAALLNLLPLESSIPNPEKMKEEFKQIRLEQREFIDNLLHPDRIQSYNLPIKINGTLRTYQQEGVNWLCFLNRYGLNGVLCDDLGLGKTLQTICILAGSHHELKQCSAINNSNEYCISNESVVMDTKIDEKFPVSLIICPSTLCAHWFHEIQHFAQTEDLNPLIYGGSPTVRQKLINWNYVVLDEGHIIKSSKSKVTRAVKHLVAQHRLILTGTPIQNRVSELWSLFDFLMPEFLGTEQYFLAKFARPVAASRDIKASKSDQQAGQLALEKLHRLVLPFMLRRLKEDVMQDLPPKIIQDFACKMTPIQRKLYESFQKTDEGQQVMNFVSANSGDFYSECRSSSFGCVSTSHGFHALRYFQAVCNHPCLVLKSNHPLLDEIKQELCVDSMEQLRAVDYSGKLLALCRLLTDCGFGSPNSINGTNSGNSGNTLSSTSGTSTSSHYLDSYPGLLSQHRALMFFQTREMLQLTGEMLKKQFPWITATRLDGTVPVNERHNRVVR